MANIRLKSPQTVKPTKLYGYPCFKYGDWRVIRKIPTYFGEHLSMVTYKNKFAYLASDSGYSVGGIKIRKNSNSKDYDLDIGFRGIYTPKQVISIIQTPISWKDRYWVIWMREGYSGIYPKEVEVFLNRENI